MEKEAVKVKKSKLKGKGKKRTALEGGESSTRTAKTKVQQVLPNPDEVIELERPGSSTSQQSKVELFAAESASETEAKPAEKPRRPGTASSLDKPDGVTSRSASPALLPFRTSQVTPTNGSEASLRSREAWSGVDPKEEKPDRPRSATSNRSTKPEITTLTQDETAVAAGDNRSIKSGREPSAELLPAPEMKGEEQAYVPYLFARDTIVRIVDDMHKMKAGHLGVINQIEVNYKLIEDETQRQFNSFVLNLRNVYKDKLAIFQHVITIHRKDTDKKKEYWDGNLTSLNKQNKKLLGDKKALLIQNKLLLGRIGDIGEEKTREFAGEIDALNLRLSNETKSHSEDVEKFDKEKTELLEEIERLKEQPVIRHVPVAATAMTVDVESESRQMEPVEPHIVTKEVIVDMSEAERAELNAERQRMVEEMARVSLQREELEKERAVFVEDRKRLGDEKSQLQLKINESEKGVAEWKGKYNFTKTQLLQFGSLRNDYDLLLAAYNAMVLAAGNPGEVDENIAKRKADKVSLEEDKKELEKDIAKWEKDFKEQTGKEPTEEDEPDSIKEFKVMLVETEGAVKRLDVEVDTMEKVKNGEAPTTPEQSADAEKAVIQAEPVIKVVEVKVPDPDSLVKLEAAEEKNDKLQKENANLQTKIGGLSTEIADLKNQISDLEAKLKKSEAENKGNMKTILKLTNTLKAESAALKEAKSGAVIAIDARAADQPDTAGGAADHSECQVKVEELEATIARLESDLENADAGFIHDDGSDKINALQAQLDSVEEELRKEQSEHENTKEELEELKNKIKDLEEQATAGKGAQDELIKSATVTLAAQLAHKEKELKDSKARVNDLEGKLMANVPVDTAAEMKKLIKKIAQLAKDNDAQSKKAAESEGKAQTLETEKNSLQKILDKEKATNTTTQASLQTKLKAAKEDKEKELTKLAAQWDKKEKTRVAESKAKVEALNKKIKELEARPAVAAAPRGKADAAGGDAKSQKQVAVLTEQLQDKKRENKDLQAKITQLQDDVKKAKSEGGVDSKEQKKQEKILKEMAKKLDMESKKAERDGAKVKQLETDMAALSKDRDTKEAELKKLKVDMDQLGVTAAQALELGEQVQTLEAEVKHLNKETSRLTEAYNTERVQRKKYFNMVEDMKGKIRVYCRARPMSRDELGRGNFSVLKSPDEYSINVESTRGLKEFSFDRIFMPENTQEQVFEDTYHLVQSAVDGYNVCIFAYGQTGSGKTFTMIGDGGKAYPGIAPRAFSRIFEVIEENKDKFDFTVTSYMMELYNDKLLDLYAGKDGTPDDKMEIKKDKNGLVYVRGAQVRDAPTEEALNKLFDDGSKNRHTASTKMNAESSRSHLVLSVIIEGTNKTNGQVSRGKLSLVDLAGSERVGKTGASAETLKEANSINKSLAALGDVISALSSDQQFIPYRNNKLTMLMQDSLGGNAKTLMFVNISPADYNADETITSLTYASRVKLITNDAQKNQDNKEIARLKAVIAKLKTGEAVDEEADAE